MGDYEVETFVGDLNSDRPDEDHSGADERPRRGKRRTAGPKPDGHARTISLTMYDRHFAELGRLSGELFPAGAVNVSGAVRHLIELQIAARAMKEE